MIITQGRVKIREEDKDSKVSLELQLFFETNQPANFSFSQIQNRTFLKKKINKSCFCLPDEKFNRS